MIAWLPALSLVLAAAPSVPDVAKSRPSHARPVPAADTPAPVLSDQEVRRRIDGYLGSIDTPTPAAAWRALGPHAAPILEQLAADQAQFPSRRARALDGLAQLGGPEAVRAVHDALSRSQEPLSVRLTAVRAAGSLLRGQELLRELRPALSQDPSHHVRASAAEVLAERGGEEGCALAQAQVSREPAHARARFARAMRSCQPSDEGSGDGEER